MHLKSTPESIPFEPLSKDHAKRSHFPNLKPPRGLKSVLNSKNFFFQYLSEKKSL